MRDECIVKKDQYLRNYIKMYYSVIRKRFLITLYPESNKYLSFPMSLEKELAGGMRTRAAPSRLPNLMIRKNVRFISR